MSIKERFKDFEEKNQDNFFYVFIENIIIGIRDHEVMMSGAALTYYFILSLFPLIIFLLGILSYTTLATDEVMANLLRILPMDARNIVGSIVSELVASRSETLLSTSIILSLWTGSVGITGLFKAINKAYNTKETRNYFKRKFLAIIFTIILAALMVLVLSTLVFGEVIAIQIFSYFGAEDFFYRFWQSVRIIVPLLAMITMFTGLYMVAPSTKKYGKIKLRYAVPGAIFTTIGWILASYVFSFYVKNFGNYSTTYGSLGGIIILLIWLNLTNIIIVLGAELNGAFKIAAEKVEK